MNLAIVVFRFLIYFINKKTFSVRVGSPNVRVYDLLIVSGFLLKVQRSAQNENRSEFFLDLSPIILKNIMYMYRTIALS
jgi:hypothetical protein